MKPIAILFLFAVSGCYLQSAKDNAALDPEQVEQIVVGKTTIGEAFALLGSPRRSVRLLEHEAYVFEQTAEKQSGLLAILLVTRRVDRGDDSVTLIVDRGGIVRAVGSHFHADEPSFGTPWGD
jgi:hypothetical protein